MADNIETGNLAEGTPAANSLKTHAIADTIKRMQGMSHDDITKLWDQFATIDKNFGAAVDNSGKNKSSIAMKPSAASPSTQTLKEDITLIFGEDAKELSEEFINNATTLFEAALSLKVAELRESVFEEAAEVVAEQVEAQVAEITENLDDYLNYAVNEWLEENKLAVEAGLKFNQMESFFDAMKTLFVEHNIDIPTESIDVVESLTAEIDELKSQLDEQIEKNIDNQKIIDEAVREAAFDEISEGLAATQVEKLKTLSEGIDYSDLSDYKKKVLVIKEAHFKKDVKDTSIIKEENNESNVTEVKSVSGPMSHYADAISKQTKY